AIYGITVQDMAMAGVPYPIIFETYYRSNPIYGPNEPPYEAARQVTATTPNIHDITLQNVTTTPSDPSLHASSIVGLPESCIRNVTLSNVSVDSGDFGIHLRHMTGAFANVTSTPHTPPPFVVQENVTVNTSGSTPSIGPTPPQAGQIACSAQ
ncbi:MAG TPA: hypothetical protein VMV37_01170, partial [Gammaproteobacteria bacterium]|nr:hypothetical protein [Gammaproteobacteria bacterium]